MTGKPPSDRIERFRRRFAAADLGPFSSRELAKLRRRVQITERLIQLDETEPFPIKSIDLSDSWQNVFGASRSTVLRTLKQFSTHYDPLP
jgi:hypothetical protein